MRPAQAERRERMEVRSAPTPERAERPAAPGYGRPAARTVASFAGPSAFLAQLIAQQEADFSDAPRARAEDGLAAYRRMTGDDLVVVGPAGAVGLLL